MKILKIVFISTAFIFMSNAATHAASPHWTHEEQSTWGAIQDSTQTVVPLNYPYAECSIGTHQSPIDLAAAQIDNTKKLNGLEVWYDVDNAPIFNNTGHAVQLNTSSDYTRELKIGEESYPLIQLHFHEPSEHVIGNTKFPAELHYVHVGADGKLIVLAVAINVGEENTTFQTILDNTPHQEGQNPSTGIQINPASLLPPLHHNRPDFYTLAGSLTTPPCSEGVQWYLMSEAITISAAQLEQLKGFYTNNARSSQGLNGRAVLSTQ